MIKGSSVNRHFKGNGLYAVDLGQVSKTHDNRGNHARVELTCVAIDGIRQGAAIERERIWGVSGACRDRIIKGGGGCGTVVSDFNGDRVSQRCARNRVLATELVADDYRLDDVPS